MHYWTEEEEKKSLMIYKYYLYSNCGVGDIIMINPKYGKYHIKSQAHTRRLLWQNK